MVSEHVDIIASPGNLFAVGTDLQAGEIHNRTGGRMFSGDPLGIDEGEWAGRDGQSQLGVKDVFRSIAQIDVEMGRILSRLGITGGGDERDEKQ